MKENRLFRTDFLFPTPTIVQGMSTVFNVWGRYHKFNVSRSNEEADRKAIQSDWGITGQDIEDVLTSIERELKVVNSTPG